MKDKVLVIGSGAREQCLAWKLSQSPDIEQVYIYPGGAGINVEASSKIVIPSCPPNINDFDLLAHWCLKQQVALVVVGPEVHLVNGIADVLESRGVACFGPHSAAAMIEGSKWFAKEFMLRHSIPTARYKCFSDMEQACTHIHSAPYRATVVKASGLAAGKGVIVAGDQEEACLAVNRILKDKAFGDAGLQIVVEEHLEGDEVSVLCFSDGERIAVMPPAQDHKRLLDDDLGPNTGGMGAYSPCPQVSDEMLKYIKSAILTKAINGLRNEGRPYVGVLYAGIMLTIDGPKVLEFNCRFGDPECQVILPLLESDFYRVIQSCVKGNLNPGYLAWKRDQYAVGVVMASGGYPGSYDKGKTITGVSEVEENQVLFFHAATKYSDSGALVTSGGRVLTVVARGDSLKATSDLALNRVKLVQFEGAHYRSDIAKRGVAFQARKRLTYASSGVSIKSGDEFVRQISPFAKSTNRTGCASVIGGFGGVFDLAKAGYKQPILVAGSDGVGTKLMIANACNRHSTIGIDLVAMCVNDILTHNAEPLFFLDYYACGKLSLDVARDVVKGIAEGCRAAGCALIGGETAEMPGMYQGVSYDIGGFVVGAYEKERDLPLPRIDAIVAGDVVVGIGSTGLHSNGFSLVRKLVEKRSLSWNEAAPFDHEVSLGESLLTATAIYSKQLLPVLRSNKAVKAAAHITGGGIVGNLPRVLPGHLGAKLDADNWTQRAVFGWIHQEGDVEIDEMLRTFNCGLGLCLIVDSRHADDVIAECRRSICDVEVNKVGEVVAKKDDVKRIVVENMGKSLRNCYTPVRKTINASDVPPTPQANGSMRKKRVAVMISGSGTNLQALIDNSLTDSKSSYRVELVISNKPDVHGLVRAQKHNILTKVICSKSYKDREAFDRSVHEELTKHRIDIICLAGFMRLLSDWFVSQWRGRLLNIHPSLLPLFKGLHPHKQALDAGVRVSGCSVHFVVEEMDAGAIIGQETVPVYPTDSIECLQSRIKKSEHKLFPRALSELCDGEVRLATDDNKAVWDRCFFK